MGKGGYMGNRKWDRESCEDTGQKCFNCPTIQYNTCLVLQDALRLQIDEREDKDSRIPRRREV